MPAGVTYLFAKCFSASKDIGPTYITKIAADFTKETEEEHIVASFTTSNQIGEAIKNNKI